MLKHKEKSVIALYDEHHNVLLQDRDGISGSGEAWGFFGGGIELGETTEQALRREILEELGVTLGTFTLLTTYKSFRNDHRTYNLVHLFIGPLSNMLQRAKQKEGKGMQLFPLTKLGNVNFGRTDKDIARAIVTYLNNT